MFQDGSDQSIWQNHGYEAPNGTGRSAFLNPGPARQTPCPKTMACQLAGPETILRRRGEKSPTPGQTDSLASNNFTYSFTFFPKFFSSFPHGTCSLSVSRKYLALEGHYLLISAAVPSNTTHDGRQLLRGESDSTGLLPSATRYLNDELHPSPRNSPPQGYKATARGGSFSY